MAEKTDTDLFRSIHVSTPGYANGTVADGEPVLGVLYPDFHPRRISKTKVRAADLTTYDDGGVPMVRNDGGTSLFDKPYVLPGGSASWHSFKIPAKTVIPESLVVRFTNYNESFGANHYQIESKAGTMRQDAMKGALDNLARNAIVRLIELGEMTSPAKVK